MRKKTFALLILTCALGSIPGYAVRRDFSPAEISCARSVGAAIDNGRNYADPSVGPRTLAWISDLVIRGSATSIRSDLEGAYHTLVDVQVTETLKGTSLPQITVTLRSGLAWAASEGQIMRLTVSHEPTFTVGEDLFLFLTLDYASMPGTTAGTYALDANQYNLVAKGKYLVVDAAAGRVVNAAFPVERHTIQQMRDDVQTTVSAQSTNCGNP